MRRTPLRLVGDLDAERLARALAEVSEAPAEPKARLARLAEKLAPGLAASGGATPTAEAPPPAAAAPEAPPAAPPAAPEPAEPMADVLRRTLLEYAEVLKRYRADFDRLVDADPAAAGTDATLRRLHALRLVLIQYPVAAQALFAALVAEGRRYAETPEGRAARDRLAASDLVRRGRAVFEAVSGGVLGEHQGDLPSSYLEAFLDALRREGLESVLGTLFGGQGA